MSIPLHYYAPPVLTCDHAPLIRDQQQRITGLEAQVRSLTEQLHAKEALVTRYRHIDEAADVLRQQHRGVYTPLSFGQSGLERPDPKCTGCSPGTPYPCAVRRAIDPEETTT